MKKTYIVTLEEIDPDFCGNQELEYDVTVFPQTNCCVWKQKQKKFSQTSFFQKVKWFVISALDLSPYWVSILYASMCLVLSFKDPNGYIISVSFFFYSLFELILELLEIFFRIYGIKKQVVLLALLFISLMLGIYVVPDCHALYKLVNDNGTTIQALSLLSIFGYQFVVALKHHRLVE